MLYTVALLAEGVDINRYDWAACHTRIDVALLAEGVDRNSALHIICGECCPVALLAEGVDRNGQLDGAASGLCLSPSSRRAWIEILGL